ncbi:hypothetical protein [Moraxella lacunata]|uniref:hypothetical protein n=1 Tax=Moraxella lacunata TaxID=477 RepID=UPI003EE3B582
MRFFSFFIANTKGRHALVFIISYKNVPVKNNAPKMTGVTPKNPLNYGTYLTI